MAENEGQMFELPQYSLAVQGDKDAPGLDIYLCVSFGAAQHQFYLCNTNNYEQVAREIHKKIMDAGVQGRRAKSGLVVAKGPINASIPKAEGRK